MQRARLIILRHPALLAALLFCTLLAKALVPAGYMPTIAGGTIVIELCSGTIPAKPVVSMPGMHHGQPDHGTPVKAEQPCAYAGLASPALASVDPGLLATALAFAFLLVLLQSVLAPPAPPARLRPPLRAPPTTA